MWSEANGRQRLIATEVFLVLPFAWFPAFGDHLKSNNSSHMQIYKCKTMQLMLLL